MSLPLTQALKQKAQELGFTQAGICPAVPPPGLSRFREWLEAGYAGEMHYLPERAEAYAHPRHVMEGARSVLMLAMNYTTAPPQTPNRVEGRVSRYAWGPVDYHDLIHERLRELVDFLRAASPGARARGVVDTAPLLEREFAQLAGLGWIGKNTLLLNKQHGSWFFLAALLTDIELDYDAPHQVDHCGTCRACLDACPTDAFPEPYLLDATRCISYLTIELREAVPAELREGMHDWLFGCDICQDVCPWNHRAWNHRAPTSLEPSFTPAEGMNPVDLAELFELDDDAFRRRFRHTPLWRSKRRGILRNAAIVLGNKPSPAGLRALCRGLQDPEPLVRAACAWAIGQHASPLAEQALETRRTVEIEPDVLREIDAAMKVMRRR